MVVAALAVAGLAAAQSTRRQASLVVIGGTVITENEKSAGQNARPRGRHRRSESRRRCGTQSNNEIEGCRLQIEDWIADWARWRRI
jgi:hypothetical protein